MSERMKEIFLLLIWAREDVTIFFRVRNTFKISFHNVYDSMCSVIFYMNNAQRYPSIPFYIIYLYVTHNMEISTSEACTYTYMYIQIRDLYQIFLFRHFIRHLTNDAYRDIYFNIYLTYPIYKVIFKNNNEICFMI